MKMKKIFAKNKKRNIPTVKLIKLENEDTAVARQKEIVDKI